MRETVAKENSFYWYANFGLLFQESPGSPNSPYVVSLGRVSENDKFTFSSYLDRVFGEYEKLDGRTFLIDGRIIITRIIAVQFDDKGFRIIQGQYNFDACQRRHSDIKVKVGK